MLRDPSHWEEMFRDAGAFWRHPGPLACPFVRLSSGLISDGFFNGGKVQENDPALLGHAAQTLWQWAGEAAALVGVTRVVGAAEGATYLSARIAEAGRFKSAYAVPTSPTKEAFAFERQDFQDGEVLVLAEDTVTTGLTLRKLARAAEQTGKQVRFAPVTLALCNRSGSDVTDGRRIISLIRPAFVTWEEGKNPYTENGQEVVPPISAKGAKNWEILNQPYEYT